MDISCPSCDEVTSANATECPNCAWPFHQEAAAPRPMAKRMNTLQKRAADVEIAMTIDTTGSSMQFSHGIPWLAENVLLQVLDIVRSCKVWLQTHGDEDLGQLPLLRTDQASVDETILEIERLRFEGGGFPPDEDHLKAIENLTRIVPFTGSSSCRSVLIAIVNAESKPLDSESPYELGRQLSDRGILVYVVGEATPRIVEFIAGASGMLLPISDSPSLDELSAIVTQVGASIEGTLVSGATKPIAIP